MKHGFISPFIRGYELVKQRTWRDPYSASHPASVAFRGMYGDQLEHIRWSLR